MISKSQKRDLFLRQREYVASFVNAQNKRFFFSFSLFLPPLTHSLSSRGVLHSMVLKIQKVP